MDSPITVPPQAARVVDIIKDRRSIYQLRKEVPLGEEELLDLINNAVRVAPSFHGAQTSRVCVLLGKHHDTFWNMTKEALYKVTSAEHAASGAGKIEACFQSGCGTVLFFEDTRAMQAMQEESEQEMGSQSRDAAYYESLANQNSAAAQFAVWSVLAQAGVGASLQHYQNLVAEPVRKTFQIPPWWTLMAMMPFGGVGQPAEAKTHAPLETRFLVKDEDGLSSYGGTNSSRGRGLQADSREGEAPSQNHHGADYREL